MSTIWTHQYASGESHTNFEFPVGEDPCSWFAPSTSGTVVIVNEGGTVLTYVAVGGEVIRGRFTSLTSNTCTKLTCGNGEPPMPALATAGTSSAASIDTRTSTEESTARSAETSLGTRFSTLDSGDSSGVTSLDTARSALTSVDTSLGTRFSTSVSTLTSADVSLTTRISIAESRELSKSP